MKAQSFPRLQRLRLIATLSFPREETLKLGEALDKCEAFDIRQVAWELGQAHIKVTAEALLAMALYRAVVRQVAEQYASQEQLKQAKKLVPRTGDTQAS